ncbi:hypothetical protein HF086_015483 [Spodoptera exigua]|uniref:PI3K/PI4K catalytic domain-containing protein n=1 Tax=Spodoptera exigua TaxID=7107 RepID=A0A922MF67_SPOEX|nr:hypothetical protein HF086_015483 [Spodoptera exigua]
MVTCNSRGLLTSFWSTLGIGDREQSEDNVLNSVSLHQIKKQSGKSLRAWLELEHGPPNSEGFLRAQNNFLTQEFVDVMDGENSDMFQYFKILILRGLIAARKHCDQIIHVVELMRMGGQLSCLRSSSAVSSFRARFHVGRTEPALAALVERLVRDALHSLSTRLYDNYQLSPGEELIWCRPRDVDMQLPTCCRSESKSSCVSGADNDLPKLLGLLSFPFGCNGDLSRLLTTDPTVRDCPGELPKQCPMHLL